MESNARDLVCDDLLDKLFNKKMKPLCEMAHVGYIKNKFEVYVHSNEGMIPHFHVWDTSTSGNEFHTCIYFKEAKYFEHHGKTSRFNAKDRKDLIEFLKSKPTKPRGPFEDYWHLLVFMWSVSNPDNELDLNLQMPDYSQLPRP